MTPVEKAAQVYENEPCARTFREDLTAHLIHGYVHSTPEAFVMARPVCRSWTQQQIVDPWFNELTTTPDTWHVYLAAADISILLGFMPTPLPWISWERNNSLRFYKLTQLQTHGPFRPSQRTALRC